MEEACTWKTCSLRERNGSYGYSKAFHFTCRPQLKTGMEFAGWKGRLWKVIEAALTPRRNMRIAAVFRPSGLSRKGGL